MAHQFVMTISRLRKFYERREVLKDISLSFYPGAKIGILGGNGAGKSTLLRVMAGVEKDFEGELWHAPGTTIGFVPQEPLLDADKDVRAVVDEAVMPIRMLLERYEEISEKLGQPLEPDEMEKALADLEKAQAEIDACDGWELERHLEIAADALRLPPWDASVKTISGGERRRVALCQTLLRRPDLLLLDEPTNHLDADTVAWLEHHLAEYPGAVIAVTHDRYFLDNVAQWILELDRGQGIPWKGNYSSWLEQKKQRLELEEKSESARQRTLARELEWVRMSPRARQAKSKARLKAYEQLAAQEFDAREESVVLTLPPGPHLGNQVVDARKLCKGYGERQLIDGLDFALPPGGIVGVIGPNGAGKTTLFRMILGQEQPDSGELLIGPSVVFAYVDQNRETLDANKSVFDEVADGKELIKFGKREINSRAYLARFNFRGADQQKKVGELSGGERNRIQLAKLLRRGGNVILLDEPTNDLDVDTLRVLEEALLGFGGCAVIISHDRWFLDRIATHILSFEDDGKVRWFEGNYYAYHENRRQDLGEEADRPKRLKYRKLSPS